MTMDVWRIREDDLPSHDEAYLQTIFTLSNGAFGALGVSPLAKPGTGGTYVGGLHCEVEAALHPIPALGSLHRDSEGFPDDREILKHTVFDQPIAPNLFGLELTFNGRRLYQPLRLSRTLDMRHGILDLQTELTLPGGRLTVQVSRFVSHANRHLAAERITITSPCAGKLDYALGLDATVRYLSVHDFWATRRGHTLGHNGCVWTGEAQGTRIGVTMAMAATAPHKTTADAGRHGGVVMGSVELSAGESVHLDRFIGVTTTVADPSAEPLALATVTAAAAAGFDLCRQQHEAAMQAFWAANDIVIEGAPDDQRALRFCLFQIRSVAPPTPAFSIGPNLLAGPRYRAAVFWDTDVYIIPYYTKSMPETALQHMRYRHRTLPEARTIARERYNLAGARYPWQAMADGRDALAPWNIFAPNQIHIVADVAWAVADYYAWTGDEDYMRNAGREILAETARFWISRMTRTERGLEILKVCGPDETHPTVNNSLYTNLLARQNLRLAAGHNPDADPAERQTWLDAADSIFIPAPRADRLVEQCDGFFALPEPPSGVGCVDGDAYQSVKQADVLMLPVMLPMLYDDASVAANYAYYEPRTTHESSLSAGVHAIVAARLGRMDEAYRQFRNTAYIDLGNVHKNTHKGLHAASTAMAPRAVIEGFAGLHIENEKPVVKLHLPDAWQSIAFQFSYRGQRYGCHLKRTDIGRCIECQPLASAT